MSEAEQLDLTGVAAQASEPRETILVVDDDPGVLSMASDILRAVGYRVFSTGDPSEALRLAGSSADRIHLLLTDIVMPLMNGESRRAGSVVISRSGNHRKISSNITVISRRARFAPRQKCGPPAP